MPHYVPSSVYTMNLIEMADRASSLSRVYFRHPGHGLRQEDSIVDEDSPQIELVTDNPDTEPPELDVENISIDAEPTKPDNPDGETLGRSQSLQLPGLALPPPRAQGRRKQPFSPQQRPQLPRLRAPVGLPHDPPLILGTELSACRLIGYLRVRSNAIELRRFARNSSRSTGSFRYARFFSVFFFFDHQHRLSSFPPCTLINVQASVSPMLAQRGFRVLSPMVPSHELDG